MHLLNRWAGLIAGPWFLGITGIELGLLGTDGPRARMKLHAIFVGMFLIAAHVAMIFGMLDPTLLNCCIDPEDGCGESS